MFPVYFLLLWTACYGNGVSSVFSHEPSDSSEGTTPHQIDGNETVEYNKSMVEAGDAFRKHLVEAIIHVEKENLTEGMVIDDVKPVSNTSLSDLTSNNWKKEQLHRMRERIKQQRIQIIREYILLMTWSNRTSNNSRRSERSSPEVEIFRSIPIDIKTIHGENTLSQTISDVRGFITNWFATFIRGNYTDDELGEPKLYVSFADLELDEIVVAPDGILWPVCGGNSNVVFEILTKLDNLTYPSPLRLHAKSMIKKTLMGQQPLHSRCVPSGWKSLSIIHYYKDLAVYSLLKNFIPTMCSCSM